MLRNLGDDASEHRAVEHVNDERIEARTLLDLKDPHHRRGVKGEHP